MWYWQPIEVHPQLFVEVLLVPGFWAVDGPVPVPVVFWERPSNHICRNIVTQAPIQTTAARQGRDLLRQLDECSWEFDRRGKRGIRINRMCQSIRIRKARVVHEAGNRGIRINRMCRDQVSLTTAPFAFANIGWWPQPLAADAASNRKETKAARALHYLAICRVLALEPDGYGGSPLIIVSFRYDFDVVQIYSSLLPEIPQQGFSQKRSSFQLQPFLGFLVLL